MKTIFTPELLNLLPWIMFIVGLYLIISSVFRRRQKLQIKLNETLKRNQKLITLAQLKSHALIEEEYNRRVYNAILIPLPPLKMNQQQTDQLKEIDKYQEDKWVRNSVY